MDSKQAAPPSYSEAVDAPGQGRHNTGYLPPPGEQGGHQPQAAGYPAGGYPAPPPANYAQPPGGGYYYPPQQGGYTFQHQTAVVVNQPMVGGGGVVQGTVPDHMGLAIFTTICCCWPLGLVAIMRAQESRRAMERGDFSAASTFSMEARRYSMWAIAGGILSIVAAVIIIVVVISSNTYTYY